MAVYTRTMVAALVSGALSLVSPLALARSAPTDSGPNPESAASAPARTATCGGACVARPVFICWWCGLNDTPPQPPPEPEPEPEPEEECDPDTAPDGCECPQELRGVDCDESFMPF